MMTTMNKNRTRVEWAALAELCTTGNYVSLALEALIGTRVSRWPSLTLNGKQATAARNSCDKKCGPNPSCRNVISVTVNAALHFPIYH